MVQYLYNVVFNHCIYFPFFSVHKCCEYNLLRPKERKKMATHSCRAKHQQAIKQAEERLRISKNQINELEDEVRKEQGKLISLHKKLDQERARLKKIKSKLEAEMQKAESGFIKLEIAQAKVQQEQENLDRLKDELEGLDE